MNVSIIIVSYNTKALLKQCLLSVFEKTRDIAFEVIVVDNSSHDGSPQMVREEFPNVMLVESENKGFGHANNVGAKYAKGKYLFLLNPDTIVLNNAVKILFDFIDNHPKVGICGGNLFGADDKKPATSYHMFLPSILLELDIFFARILKKLLYGKNASFNHTPRPKKVGYIIGADLMIRTDLFLCLNGFDTDFFVYYEETELTFRVKKAGHEVFSVPQAEIIHLEGQTFSGNLEKRTRLSLESRNKYYRKTHTRFIIWICNGIYVLTGLLRYCLSVIMNKPSAAKYWKCIIRHTFTGF
jgi:GT2 family glycosyltransferase